ncbi:hypothetical protein FCM35_KLT08264 [Carex littledalei]|uniref:Uncharacterized protein n=1 Tax=Carex littledalei TaxID=544730 RepID=A0A833QP32_9POAL|nr:hypothetical protein FCM35_KLT08264 [Carex littledalei]
MLGWEVDHLSPSKSSGDMVDLPKQEEHFDPELMEKAWQALYVDCLLALGSCVQGELTHFATSTRPDARLLEGY